MQEGQQHSLATRLVLSSVARERERAKRRAASTQPPSAEERLRERLRAKT